MKGKDEMAWASLLFRLVALALPAPITNPKNSQATPILPLCCRGKHIAIKNSTQFPISFRFLLAKRSLGAQPSQQLINFIEFPILKEKFKLTT